MPTFRTAIREVWETDWRHRRSRETLLSQAERAIADLGGMHVDPSRITPVLVRQATSGWYGEGLSPATITKRLNCLSKLGVNVEGCRPKRTKALKWWLNDADMGRLLAWLRTAHTEQHGAPEALDMSSYVMADFIVWTVHTGLRVEETLALRMRDILAGPGGRASVVVSGTKTASAQATLPLMSDAQAAAHSRGWGVLTAGSDCPLFPYEYAQLREWWQECRKFLGVQDNPTATLKALRRSAARKLHIQKGMPLDMVRQYLRHEDIATTMEYLRLTGGYGEEEMRKWLNG